MVDLSHEFAPFSNSHGRFASVTNRSGEARAPAYSVSSVSHAERVSDKRNGISRFWRVFQEPNHRRVAAKMGVTTIAVFRMERWSRLVNLAPTKAPAIKPVMTSRNNGHSRKPASK